jgi:hypothetical protein
LVKDKGREKEMGTNLEYKAKVSGRKKEIGNHDSYIDKKEKLLEQSCD